MLYKHSLDFNLLFLMLCKRSLDFNLLPLMLYKHNLDFNVLFLMLYKHSLEIMRQMQIQWLFLNQLVYPMSLSFKMSILTFVNTMYLEFMFSKSRHFLLFILVFTSRIFIQAVIIDLFSLGSLFFHFRPCDILQRIVLLSI